MPRRSTILCWWVAGSVTERRCGTQHSRSEKSATSVLSLPNTIRLLSLIFTDSKATFFYYYTLKYIYVQWFNEWANNGTILFKSACCSLVVFLSIITQSLSSERNCCNNTDCYLYNYNYSFSLLDQLLLLKTTTLWTVCVLNYTFNNYYDH